MLSAETLARSRAARAATAPRSIADTLASAPPFCPSPRLPPTHSAIGVRAPERMTMSGRPLLDKALLLASKVVDEVGSGRRSDGARSQGSAGTLAPVPAGRQAQRAPHARRPP